MENPKNILCHVRHFIDACHYPQPISKKYKYDKVKFFSWCDELGKLYSVIAMIPFRLFF